LVLRNGAVIGFAFQFPPPRAEQTHADVIAGALGLFLLFGTSGDSGREAGVCVWSGSAGATAGADIDAVAGAFSLAFLEPVESILQSTAATTWGE